MKLSVPQVVSTGPGLLMATIPAIGSPGPALIAAAMAVIVVLAGLLFRPAATLAVLLAASVLTLWNPPPLFAALSGLCAAIYLVLRHAGTATAPTVIAALGFAFAGLVAVAFPLRVPWLPLLAPLAVVGIYALATYPFLGARR